MTKNADDARRLGPTPAHVLDAHPAREVIRDAMAASYAAHHGGWVSATAVLEALDREGYTVTARAEPVEQLDQAANAIARAIHELGEICRQGPSRRFRMHIPAEPDRDSDLIIMAGLNAGELAVATLGKAALTAARASQAPRSAQSTAHDTGAAHGHGEAAEGRTEARECDGSSDPRRRCGLHHTTEIGNAMGGYDCCCGDPWLGRSNNCATNAKTGDPVLLHDRVHALIRYFTEECDPERLDRCTDAVIPAIREQIARDIETEAERAVGAEYDGLSYAARIARGEP